MRYRAGNEHHAVLFAAVVLLGNVVSIVGGPLPGAFAHAAAFLGTLNVAVKTVDRERRALLEALATIPLVQLMALTVAPPDIDLSTRYVLISALTLVAVIVAAREARITPGDIGLRFNLHAAALTIPMIPASLALGLLAYDLVKPIPLAIDPMDPNEVLVPLMALGAGALVEAALFRGLLQSSAVRVFGRWRGMAYASILFAGVAVVSASPTVLLLGLYASFMFGFATTATGSIYPAAAGQLLLNVSMFIIGPFVGS